MKKLGILAIVFAFFATASFATTNTSEHSNESSITANHSAFVKDKEPKKKKKKNSKACSSEASKTGCGAAKSSCCSHGASTEKK